MNALDYILDAVLVATIFLQFRGRRLTVRNLGLPIAIVLYLLFAYLKGVPTAGNDLYLTGGGVALGLFFGIGAGVFTRVYVMVLVEVGSRQLIVGARYFSLRKSAVASPSGSLPLTAVGDAAALSPGQE